MYVIKRINRFYIKKVYYLDDCGVCFDANKNHAMCFKTKKNAEFCIKHHIKKDIFHKLIVEEK